MQYSLKLKVFVDIEFLRFFFRTNEEKDSNGINLNKSEEIVKAIFTDYPSVLIHVDTEDFTIFTQSPFDKIEADRIRYEHNFEEYVKNHNCTFSIFFMYEKYSWFDLAEKKGAICFSRDNYQRKVNRIVGECHFRVDCSNRNTGFKSWQNLLSSITELPTKQLILVDKYILQRNIINNNIIPILQQFTEKSDVSCLILTDVDNRNSNKKNNQEVAKVEVCHDLITMGLDVDIDVIFYSIYDTTINSRKRFEDKVDFHDRILYGQYFIIDSTKGFNRENFKRPNNMQIHVETIFNLYTYRRMLNHKEIIKKHIESYFSKYPNKEVTLIETFYN